MIYFSIKRRIKQSNTYFFFQSYRRDKELNFPTNSENSTETKLYLKVKPHQVQRYLVNLARILNPAEIEVVLYLNRPLEGAIRNAKGRGIIAGAILAQDNVFFSKDSRLPWKRIQDDYFRDVNRSNNVPIFSHPLFHHSSVPPSRKRVNKVLFAGNVKPSYKEFDSTLWGMPNRWTTFHGIHKHPRFHHLRGASQIDYQRALEEHSFFLCLPGLFMPLCHNFYEACSRGCIPILHRQYLQLIEEPLRDWLYPYSYACDTEIPALIDSLTSHPLGHEEVRNQIESCFEPKHYAIHWFNKLIKANQIYLNAERLSVQLLKRNTHHE